MSNASVGLANNPDATFINPAGLAMTYGGSDISITGYSFSNSQLQPQSESVSAVSVIGSSAPYPWGFGISIQPVHFEQQTFSIAGSDRKLENSAREMHLSVGRVLDNHKLSLGGSLNIGYSTRSLQTQSHAPIATGFTFGMLYQLPERWFIGSTFTTAMTYADGLDQSTSSTIDSFFQAAYSPYRISLGTGWIPNRYFQFGTSLDFIGAHTRAGLLSNQDAAVGATVSLHPRVGVIYSFIDYEEIVGKVAAGTYFEASRIEGNNGRLHFTSAIQLQPWIFYIGAGVDFAAGYSNVIYASGLDVIKVFEKLELIPTPPKRLHAGSMPDAFYPSDDGLPRAIAKEWNEAKNQAPVDFLKVGRELPGKIKQRLEDTSESIENAIKGPKKPKKKN